MHTIKIKPSHPSQGDHVVINAEDFDTKKGHVLLDDPDAEFEGAKKATVPELRAALEAKGIEIPEGAKKADLQALLDAA